MSDMNVIILLLPVLFMIHDFEEIIMFRKWLTQNSTDISNRFPKLRTILARANAISTPAFTLAVAEEFVLLVVISFSAVYYSYYYLWLAAFMAFFLHLFIHISQCLVFRRYIPGIITSVLLVPVCICILNQILIKTAFTYLQVAALSAVGFLIMIVNVVLTHYLIGKLKI